jgi:hypothetical protein
MTKSLDICRLIFKQFNPFVLAPVKTNNNEHLHRV